MPLSLPRYAVAPHVYAVDQNFFARSLSLARPRDLYWLDGYVGLYPTVATYPLLPASSQAHWYLEPGRFSPPAPPLELRSQGVFAPLSPPVASLPPGGYAPLTPRRLRRPRGLCPLQPPPPTSLLPEFSMGGMPRLPTPYIFIICVGDVWFCCICFGDGLLHGGLCPPSGCRCS